MAHFTVPATNKAFPYKELEDNTIRLLRFLPGTTSERICCSLEHMKDYNTSLNDNAPGHIPLSYCWGKPLFTEKVVINAHDFFVTTNLRDALHALHSHNPDKAYWIDAICINQLDIEEKAVQVQQMGTVYSSAQYMIAWLGNDDERAQEYFSIIRDYEHKWLSRDPLTNRERDFTDLEREQKDTEMSKVSLLAHDTYFQRTWIMSEFVQAAEVLMLWGRQALPWQTYIDVFTDGMDLESPLNALFMSRSTLDPHSDRFSLRQVLHDLFALYHKSSCSDPRDKIFAMLGNKYLERWRDQLNLRVDYRMTAEDVALALMEDFCAADGYEEYGFDAMLECLAQALHTYGSTTFRAWLQQQVQTLRWESKPGLHAGCTSWYLSVRLACGDKEEDARAPAGFMAHFLEPEQKNIDRFWAAHEQRKYDYYSAPGLKFEWPSKWPGIPWATEVHRENTTPGMRLFMSDGFEIPDLN